MMLRKYFQSTVKVVLGKTSGAVWDCHCILRNAYKKNIHLFMQSIVPKFFVSHNSTFFPFYKFDRDD